MVLLLSPSLLISIELLLAIGIMSTGKVKEKVEE